MTLQCFMLLCIILIINITKLIAHSPESTVKNAKYTVNMIQNFIKPNIKSLHIFFSKHSKSYKILLHCSNTPQELLKLFTQPYDHQSISIVSAITILTSVLILI